MRLITLLCKVFISTTLSPSSGSEQLQIWCQRQKKKNCLKDKESDTIMHRRLEISVGFIQVISQRQAMQCNGSFSTVCVCKTEIILCITPCHVSKEPNCQQENSCRESTQNKLHRSFSFQFLEDFKHILEYIILEDLQTSYFIWTKQQQRLKGSQLLPSQNGLQVPKVLNFLTCHRKSSKSSPRWGFQFTVDIMLHKAFCADDELCAFMTAKVQRLLNNDKVQRYIHQVL